jgi:hypothetical protein
MPFIMFLGSVNQSCSSIKSRTKRCASVLFPPLFEHPQQQEWRKWIHGRYELINIPSFAQKINSLSDCSEESMHGENECITSELEGMIQL